VQYDNVINRHRKVVYTIRRKILLGEDIRGEIVRLYKVLAADLANLPTRNNPKFVEEFAEVFPIEHAEIEALGKVKNDHKRIKLAEKLVDQLYAKQEKALTTELMRGVEREVYMQVLDVLWMQHLENMQHLREGIHWRSVGQRDPLVEYRSESQKLFDSLQKTLQTEVLRAIFHVRREDINEKTVEDDEYDSELTRAAEGAVEQGVNEIGTPETRTSKDFKVKKAPTSRKKSLAKSRKKQRQNKRKGRR
jgi:preprotein translocase subunit SecA